MSRSGSYYPKFQLTFIISISYLISDVMGTQLYSKEKELALALDCEAKNNASSRVEGTFCPAVFDGWKCWLDQPADSTAKTTCPPVPGFDTSRIATRVCDNNGSWFQHPFSHKQWSNYTSCVNRDELAYRNSVNTVYEVGYFVSLVALLISIVIFSYFRSLRCARITLHLNLFTSFAVNNVLWLFWYQFVVPEKSIISANPLWCRILHTLINYVLLSNYSLMLCEGLYLHTVLVRAFAAERRLLIMLLLGGWLSPLLAIAIYVAVRTNTGDMASTDDCWMNESPAMTMLASIAGCLLVLNLALLCNIVRVLCTKLRATPHAASRPSATALQALRATFLLVPLLGLQYLVLSFRPQDKSPWEKPYEYASAVTASFQGLCVATLFCFCNGEVVSQIRRKWRAVTFRPRANSCTNTTVSFVRSTAQPLTATSEEKV